MAKTKKQADRAADAQHESDVADQDTSTSYERVFLPFVIKAYRTQQFEELTLKWVLDDDGGPGATETRSYLNNLLNLEIMQQNDWAKINAQSRDVRVARIAHVQAQLIEHLNVALLQIGTALDAHVSPIVIQRSSKEDLANVTKNGLDGTVTSGGGSKTSNAAMPKHLQK